MKTRLRRIAINVVFYLLALLATPLVLSLGMFGPQWLHIYLQQMKLRNASDLREVAAGCLELLRSDSSRRILLAPFDDERIPSAIRSKHPVSLFASPADHIVLIEFGGGFEHYGYRFEPVVSGAGQWKLIFYGEEPEDDRELLRF